LRNKIIKTACRPKPSGFARFCGAGHWTDEASLCDLEKKLSRFKDYLSQAQVHQGLAGTTPNQAADQPTQPPASLHDYYWRSYCDGLFELSIVA